jgi:hypothetical protein
MLEPCVRIPFETWMYVRVPFSLALSYVGRRILMGRPLVKNLSIDHKDSFYEGLENSCLSVVWDLQLQPNAPGDCDGLLPAPCNLYLPTPW